MFFFLAEPDNNGLILVLLNKPAHCPGCNVVLFFYQKKKKRRQSKVNSTLPQLFSNKKDKKKFGKIHFNFFFCIFFYHVRLSNFQPWFCPVILNIVIRHGIKTLIWIHRDQQLAHIGLFFLKNSNIHIRIVFIVLGYKFIKIECFMDNIQYLK